MAEGSGKAREISLEDDFGDVAVNVNGVRVEVHTDGSVLAYTNSGVDAYTNGPVRVHPARLPKSYGGQAANDSATSASAPQIGDLDGGGVYVGKSATTGKDLHAALADEREYMTFDEALEAAAKMRKQPGRENAHVPTPEELDKNLFENRNKGALKGTFNTIGSFPGSVYRSSAPCGNDHARVRWFNDRGQYNGCRNVWQPVRLVW